MAVSSLLFAKSRKVVFSLILIGSFLIALSAVGFSDPHQLSSHFYISSDTIPFQETALSDGNTSETLVFNSTQKNATVYVRIPKNATVTSAKVTLSATGYPRRGNTFRSNLCTDCNILGNPILFDNDSFFTFSSRDKGFGRFNTTPAQYGSLNKIWVGAPTGVSPLISDGVIYYPSSTIGEAYAYYENNGSKIWEVNIGSPSIYASVANFNSTAIVLVDSLDRKVILLNKSNGAEVWSHILDSTIYTTPLVYDGNVYAVDDNGKLYKLNGTDGSLNNSFSFYFIHPAGLGLVNNNICSVGSEGEYNYNLQCTDSDLKHTEELLKFNGNASSMFSADQSNNYFILLDNGTLDAFLNPNIGDSPSWSFNAEKVKEFSAENVKSYKVRTPPTVIGNYVVFVYYHSFYVLNKTDGALIFKEDGIQTYFNYYLGNTSITLGENKLYFTDTFEMSTVYSFLNGANWSGSWLQTGQNNNHTSYINFDPGYKGLFNVSVGVSSFKDKENNKGVLTDGVSFNLNVSEINSLISSCNDNSDWCLIPLNISSDFYNTNSENLTVSGIDFRYNYNYSNLKEIKIVPEKKEGLNYDDKVKYDKVISFIGHPLMNISIKYLEDYGFADNVSLNGTNYSVTQHTNYPESYEIDSPDFSWNSTGTLPSDLNFTSNAYETDVATPIYSNVVENESGCNGSASCSVNFTENYSLKNNLRDVGFEGDLTNINFKYYFPTNSFLLTSDADLQNVQYKVNLNSSWVDYSGVNDNGSNLRFYLADSTTGDKEELKYWLPSFDKNKNTVVWVKLPSIKKDDKYIFIVEHGSSSLESESNGSEVFPAFDDFKTADSNWDLTNASIQNGELLLDAEGGYVSASAFYKTVVPLDNLNVYSDVSFEGLQGSSGGGSFFGIYAYNSSSNFIDYSIDAYASQHFLRNSTKTFASLWNMYNYRNGVNYSEELSKYQDNLSFYRNKRMLLTYSNESIQNLQQGKVGFKIDSNYGGFLKMHIYDFYVVNNEGLKHISSDFNYIQINKEIPSITIPILGEEVNGSLNFSSQPIALTNKLNESFEKPLLSDNKTYLQYNALLFNQFDNALNNLSFDPSFNIISGNGWVCYVKSPFSKVFDSNPFSFEVINGYPIECEKDNSLQKTLGNITQNDSKESTMDEVYVHREIVIFNNDDRDYINLIYSDEISPLDSKNYYMNLSASQGKQVLINRFAKVISKNGEYSVDGRYNNYISVVPYSSLNNDYVYFNYTISPKNEIDVNLTNILLRDNLSGFDYNYTNALEPIGSFNFTGKEQKPEMSYYFRVRPPYYNESTANYSDGIQYSLNVSYGKSLDPSFVESAFKNMVLHLQVDSSSYSGWKLYHLEDGNWVDVSSNPSYGFALNGNTISINVPHFSDEEFRVTGEKNTGSSNGGGGGGNTIIIGQSKKIKAIPDKLDFLVEPGTKTFQEITIQNIGDESYEVKLGSDAAWLLPETGEVQIAPNQNFTFKVYVSAAYENETRNGLLKIYVNGGLEEQVPVTVQVKKLSMIDKFIILLFGSGALNSTSLLKQTAFNIGDRAVTYAALFFFLNVVAGFYLLRSGYDMEGKLLLLLSIILFVLFESYIL